MAKVSKAHGINTGHTPTIKGTSQGRNPIMSTMNKSKKRSFKAYRGQGKRSWTDNSLLRWGPVF